MSDSAMLLVNADDFGLHKDIDRGILDCIEHGSVQSVSFSAVGRTVDWNKLLELIRHGVRVGLHITLVGEPWASDGRLVPGWKHLVKQLLVPARASFRMSTVTNMCTYSPACGNLALILCASIAFLASAFLGARRLA